MNPISRRTALALFGVLPFANRLDLLSSIQSAPLKAATLYSLPWNIVLHGLFIVQSPSPRDPNLIRLILPRVEGKHHKHCYRANAKNLQKKGYVLYCTNSGKTTPSPNSSTVRLDSTSVNIPDDTALATYAHCWIDLPKPARVVALRTRDMKSCGITFTGTLGKTVQASLLPTATILSYDLAQNPSVVSDLPGAPSYDRNLILRSEPKVMPDDHGIAAMDQICKCLGISRSDFDISPIPCCPPDPQDESSTFGVSKEDESTLLELNGYHCDNSSSAAAGLQIRACMTVFTP